MIISTANISNIPARVYSRQMLGLVCENKEGNAFGETSKKSNINRSLEISAQVELCDCSLFVFSSHSSCNRNIITRSGYTPYALEDCGEKPYHSSSLTTIHIYVGIHTVSGAYGYEVYSKPVGAPSSCGTGEQIQSGEQPHGYTINKTAFICPSSFCSSEVTDTEENPSECKPGGTTLSPFNYPPFCSGTHNGGKHVDCTQCVKAFRCHSSLQRQERMCAEEKPYECKQCGKTFRSLTYARIHKRTHTEERQYVCKHCGKSLSCPSTLQLHELTHTGEKLYACQQFDKTVRRFSYFQIPERARTEEKAYKCKQCGAIFSCSNTLQLHERIHTGEKSHECKQCGKAFTQSSLLQIHKVIHTGENTTNVISVKKSIHNRVK